MAPSPASPSDVSDANFEENNTLNDASALHNKQTHNRGYIHEYAEYISSSLYCPYIWPNLPNQWGFSFSFPPDPPPDANLYPLSWRRGNPNKGGLLVALLLASQVSPKWQDNSYV